MRSANRLKESWFGAGGFGVSWGFIKFCISSDAMMVLCE
ncbi:Uncharacterised protein [Mycobacterium tuberculosis]|nr:Uncharacterised protein [Mycobacterium tuberculosis]